MANGQGNSEKIAKFIKDWKLLDRLRKCQVSRIAADLRDKGVIDAGEMSSIQTGDPRKDADFLYAILDRDKSVKKLRALAEALLNDDTVGNHVDLAKTIYKEYFGEPPVSLEHSRESTPQSKKIKREDENVRGADDKNDNEDDDDMGDPDVIKEFLGTILNDLKEHSSIKDVAPQLHSEKVVKRGQYVRLADADVEAAGGLLYGFLIGDPSLRKLRCLRDILLEDSGHQNQALGRKIRKFLKDPKGYPKLANPSLRQAQKVKTPTNNLPPVRNLQQVNVVLSEESSSGSTPLKGGRDESSTSNEPDVNIGQEWKMLCAKMNINSKSKALHYGVQCKRYFHKLAMEIESKGDVAEVAQEASFGQRCVTFHSLSTVAKSVARTRLMKAIPLKGSCFFGTVKTVEDETEEIVYYMFTCCHNLVDIADFRQKKTPRSRQKALEEALKILEIHFPISENGNLFPDGQVRVVPASEIFSPYMQYDVSDGKDILAIECKGNPTEYGVTPVDITAQDVDLNYEHYVAIVHCPGRPRNEAVEYSIGQIVQESSESEDLDMFSEVPMLSKATKKILYNMDTLPGSSGSPVIFNTGPKGEQGVCQVIGVHRGSPDGTTMNEATLLKAIKL